MTFKIYFHCLEIQIIFLEFFHYSENCLEPLNERYTKFLESGLCWSLRHATIQVKFRNIFFPCALHVNCCYFFLVLIIKGTKKLKFNLAPSNIYLQERNLQIECILLKKVGWDNKIFISRNGIRYDRMCTLHRKCEIRLLR